MAAWRRLLIALGIGIVVIVYRFPRTSMVVVMQWGAWNSIETAKALGRLHTGFGTQHIPSLWVDPVRAHTRRANHTLIRI
ncbi:MAG: hypothetical protein WAV38_26710 [Xanthobacteraceae bacterium]